MCRGWKLGEHNFQASLARMFHGWNHVGVSRNQYDAIHGLFSSHGCNIQTDTHIDAFLFKNWGKIRVTKRLTSLKRDHAWAPTDLPLSFSSTRS